MNPATFILFWIELATYTWFGFSPEVLFTRPQPDEGRDG